MTALRMVAPDVPAAPSTRPDSIWFDVHPALGISMMDHLYNRLDGAYPGRWRKNFPDVQSIENWAECWAEAFEDDGITPEEVKAALRQMRKRFAWPPSIAEFISIARPQVDPDAAYHEAVAGLLARRTGRMGEWSHRGIYWAAQALQHDLLTMGQAQIKTRWNTVLVAQLERKVLEEIPTPAPLLPAPGQTQTEREFARGRLAELKAFDIIKQPGGKVQLGWAHKIMERLQRKDPTLTRAVIELAQAALARGEELDDDTDDHETITTN